MIVKCHFAIVGLSNTFLIGEAGGGEAIMVDPSRFDVPLLKMIEDNNFYVKSVLITHNHENHVHGLKTMSKIYDFNIYASEPEVMGFETIQVSEGHPFECCGMKVEPIHVRGHTQDSLIFKVRNFLFTGDLLSAGRVGTSKGARAKEHMYRDLSTKIDTLDGETIIFPGHGPPSTLAIEQKTNPAFWEFADLPPEPEEADDIPVEVIDFDI
ncbi:MAG: MBL fold metallo-hydrolase [Spirochaetales bacterium]|nr:MBL fold metallo-hydrolase [Spirochaetales bacterium]